jgi:hypothetical protein
MLFVAFGRALQPGSGARAGEALPDPMLEQESKRTDGQASVKAGAFSVIQHLVNQPNPRQRGAEHQRATDQLNP